jgi:hypothetical protein
VNRLPSPICSLHSAVPGAQIKVSKLRHNAFRQMRLTYTIGDGRVSFTKAGALVRVVPQELAELALLRGFDDETRSPRSLTGSSSTSTRQGQQGGPRRVRRRDRAGHHGRR